MSTQGVVPTGIVHQLLDNENYLDWRVWVKTYLMGQDLWDIVESMDEPPKQEDGDEFKYWRSKNASALHVIQISCGSDAFSEIKNITSAKKAWDTLEATFKPQFNPPELTQEIIDNNEYSTIDQSHLYAPFHKAVQNGDRNATEEFIMRYPDAVRTRITFTGRTALHVSAIAGHTEIVETLVEKMSPQDLEINDFNGWTPLMAAIMCNANIKIAECMVKKNNKILTMVTPVSISAAGLAIRVGHIEMGRYLYSVTPIEFLISQDNYTHAATLVCIALIMKCYDVALHLLERCPQLTTALDINGQTPVHILACLPSLYPSGCPLKFWQKWIYESIVIDGDRVIEEIYTKFPTNIMSSGKELHGKVWSLQRFAMHFDILGFKKIYEMKLVHIQTSELLRRMCEQIIKLDATQIIKSDITGVISEAVAHGSFEFVESILSSSAHLHLAEIACCPSLNFNMFMVAIRFRQAKTFSLIHEVGSNLKTLATNSTDDSDDSDNNMLHVAGLLSPPLQVDRISGAALQMQRELQWFKEVESVVPPWTYGHMNSEFLTPRQLFTKEHKQLVSDGEKWMKETAKSCTVVGALIVTIMFAATFTVPGGNDERTGIPKFLDDKIFVLFIISVAISLFSSTTSVLMFLGILTSRYDEDDFLESLPKKLMIGLCTLFLSIAAMMMSFCAAVSMMLDDKKSWLAFLIISLASIPVALFVLMQCPLLVEIYLSTYGPSIFVRVKDEVAVTDHKSKTVVTK